VNNPIDEEIVLSTVRVARRLNVKTIAEHVHNQDIYDRLKTLGVEYVQGELIGTPLPIAQLFALPVRAGGDPDTAPASPRAGQPAPEVLGR